MTEENKTADSGFRVINVLLMEDSFKREILMEFDQTKITPFFDVAVDVQITEANIIIVWETLTYKQIVEEKTQLEVTIKMAGRFEKYGDSPIDLKQFGNINGAAMVFPFLREHLASLTAKAGIGVIMAQPTNFVANYEKNKPKE